MNNDNDSNYVSVGSWMWMMFVAALPCIGIIMVFVWAFTGDNESRKNYFRAVLMWFCLAVGLVVLLAMVGQLSVITQHLRELAPKK